MVKDKQSDIAILRTIGLKPSGVVSVFMTQGVVLGWAGTVAGVLIGVPFAANVGAIAAFLESLFNFRFFDPSVYYITDIPSDIHTVDIVWISVTAFVLAVLATIYPARRAASTDPAVALRYE